MDHAPLFDIALLLQWTALGVSVLWTIGLACIVLGSRQARRAFRGKGYLRPPSGKAWLRFIYYQHYDSFEDPAIRFYYRVARICLFLFVFLVLAVAIFVGLLCLLSRVTITTPPQIN
jgi:hypothetical protein